jgi:hypothetical protein
MAIPTLRGLQLNFRRSDLPEDHRRETWKYRLPAMVRYLKSIRPFVIGAQELRNDMMADIQDDLGENWTFVGRHHNVKVIWDAKIMDAEEGTLLETTLPSGLRNRYLITVRLTHRATGWGSWFSSIHLAANGPDEPNSPTLRMKQMSQAIEILEAHIAQHPHAHAQDGPTANSILFGDLNDIPQTKGARKIAINNGYKPLQVRLPLSKITGESINSFHGFHTPTPREGKWIDEILTRGVRVEDAAVKRTDLDALPNYATDHNGIYADLIMELPTGVMV